VRFRGDEDTARKVYEGVEAMQPQDIAECVVWVVTRPSRVNVDELVVKALAQSSGGRILRTES
jgi:NADP-dependent 3-hydroxy acid dehydrogenase YdfG